MTTPDTKVVISPLARSIAQRICQQIACPESNANLELMYAEAIQAELNAVFELWTDEGEPEAPRIGEPLVFRQEPYPHMTDSTGRVRVPLGGIYEDGYAQHVGRHLQDLTKNRCPMHPSLLPAERKSA